MPSNAFVVQNGATGGGVYGYNKSNQVNTALALQPSLEWFPGLKTQYFDQTGTNSGATAWMIEGGAVALVGGAKIDPARLKKNRTRAGFVKWF